MRDSESQSTKTAPLLHLFNQNKASTVRFEDDVLTVCAKSGRIAQSVNADEIREIKLQKLPLVTRLTVLTKQGRTVTVSGLERSTSERLHSQVQNRVEEILNDEAARKATILGPRITDLKGFHHRLPGPGPVHPAFPRLPHDPVRQATGRAVGRTVPTETDHGSRPSTPVAGINHRTDDPGRDQSSPERDIP